MSNFEDSSLRTIINNNDNITPYSEDQNSSNNNYNNNYISKNGSQLNLSGINLSSEEGLLLINNISQKCPDLTKIILNNCNLYQLPN